MDTIWSQKSILSFTAVDFLDFDFFPVKSETSECSPTQSWKLGILFKKIRHLWCSYKWGILYFSQICW